jgi:hypothetical protein
MMTNNKMKQVAALFNKKLNEEFRISRVVRFGANGLEVHAPGGGWTEDKEGLLEQLLSGEVEIVVNRR